MRHSLALRRLPVGADLQPGGGVHYRVWAPNAQHVSVVFDDRARPARALSAEPHGYFSVFDPDGRAGDRYSFALDDRDPLPDPASRWQPDGPHGSSAVSDPTTYEWTDTGWRGVSLHGQVVYELHCGTFTPEGTWTAAAGQLGALKDLGVTLIEVMPVSEFPGRFGWGYDGVFPFAPTRLYGTPDDLRAFIDRAHGLGLGVLLDVVYNHLGPDGCVLSKYADAYFTKTYANEWGDALNFEGAGAQPAREYWIANAGYWIGEYHFDGLRLDATQSMHDASPEHILAAMSRRVREAARGRGTLLVAENEPQHVRMLVPVADGGYGLDAVWNDDFHHSAKVALTGRNEGYYTDHRGTPQELISAVKHGYLFQGQRYAWQQQRRGTRTDGIAPPAFVTFLENHDQVANSASGARIHALTSPGRFRAMTALQLLAPGTPMLFQGQEMAASTPFLYFADHTPELAAAVRKGRAGFVAQFPSLGTPEMQARLDAPEGPETFAQCKLDWRERDTHREVYALHRDLLRLRREDAAIAAQGAHGIDGAVLEAEAFVLRFGSAAGPEAERVLLVNLGRDLVAPSFAEPLLAPPAGSHWEVRWSSEAPEYGGGGAPPVETDHGWRIPGHAAVLLAPAPGREGTLDD